MNFKDVSDLLDKYPQEEDECSELECTTPLEEIMPLTPLGAGAFSTVWKIDEKTILKISHRPDDLCRLYLRWVNHPNGPQIYDSAYIGQRAFYIMKKYKLNSNIAYRGPANILYNSNIKPRNSIEELAVKIRRTFHKYSYAFDLHFNNLMMDGNQFIITDPLSN